MNNVSGTRRPRHWQLRAALFVSACLAAAVLLLVRQPVAAVLVPLLLVLAAMIDQRDARVRLLARQIITGQTLEKLEVSRGEWGELCRAINRLLQERRIEQRLCEMTHAPLPDEAVQLLLTGGLTPSEPRMMAVLLVSCSDLLRHEAVAHYDTLKHWQSLCHLAREQASQQGALLQPCGDTLLLAFGAFTDVPIEKTLHTALVVANRLTHAWAGQNRNLTLSLASGSALVTVLPGVGCCILGAPVEQALQMKRLTLHMPHKHLLCNEQAYGVLRRITSLGWQPTSYRVQSSDDQSQSVFHWSGIPTIKS